MGHAPQMHIEDCHKPEPPATGQEQGDASPPRCSFERGTLHVIESAGSETSSLRRRDLSLTKQHLQSQAKEGYLAE